MAASAPPPPPLFNQPGLLPSMAAAPPRKLYRVRPEDEVEDVVWRRQEGDAADADSSSSAAEVDAEEGTLATATPARLRSVRSKVPASIRFVNKSARAVRALWVDFDGNEVAYSTVSPGTTRLYRTYATHPWIVRDQGTGARMLLSGAASVVGMSQEQAVDIEDPPALAWTTETHACFPDGFKRAARALLLAHRRLAAERAAATTTVPAASAPRLASWPPTSGAAATATTTTTTRVEVSTPRARLSIAITTDAAAAPPDGCCCGRAASVAPLLLSPRRISITVAGAGGPSLGVEVCESAAAAAGEDAAEAAAAMEIDLAPLSLGGGSGSGASGLCGKRQRAAADAPGSSGGDSSGGSSSGRAAQRARLGDGDSRGCCADNGAAAATSTHLGDLPLHLVARIVELAAPPQWQGLHLPAAGRRGIKPTLLACSPDTKTQREEDAEAAAAVAAAAAAAAH